MVVITLGVKHLGGGSLKFLHFFESYVPDGLMIRFCVYYLQVESSASESASLSLRAKILYRLT